MQIPLFDEWRPVPGYEGLYEVSDAGDVASLNWHNTGERKLMCPSRNEKGYLQVSLVKEKISKCHKVHRLVAMAFIPNPLDLPQINHIDEDKGNNYAWNLEWCTNIYNSNYGKRNENMGRSEGFPVLQIDKAGNVVNEYYSTHEAQRRTGINASHIIDVCNGGKGIRKTAGGYVWKYKKDYNRSDL